MDYTIIDAKNVGGIRPTASFHVPDLDNMDRVSRLTECVMINISRLLNEAQDADLGRCFLPMLHNPLRTGAVILVQHDAFVILEPYLGFILQECIEGIQGVRQEVA